MNSYGRGTIGYHFLVLERILEHDKNLKFIVSVRFKIKHSVAYGHHNGVC